MDLLGEAQEGMPSVVNGMSVVHEKHARRNTEALDLVAQEPRLGWTKWGVLGLAGEDLHIAFPD